MKEQAGVCCQLGMDCDQNDYCTSFHIIVCLHNAKDIFMKNYTKEN